MIKRLDLQVTLFPFVCDLFLADVSLYLARHLRLVLKLGKDLGQGEKWLQFDPLLYLITPLIWALIFILISAFKYDTQHNVTEFKAAAITTTLTTLVLIGSTFFVLPNFSRLLLLYFLILNLFLLSVSRTLLRLFFYDRGDGWFRKIQCVLRERVAVNGHKLQGQSCAQPSRDQLDRMTITTAKEHSTWLQKFGFLDKYGEFITLGLLVATVSLINIVWLAQDTRPQPEIDANIYLRKTFDFVNILEEQGISQFGQAITSMIYGGRPPLYQLFAVPFIYLFGRSADAALLVNVVFEAILLLSIYGIGRCVKNGKAGLLAALLVATYPPVVGLSRIFLPNFALLACVALSLWLLLLLLKTRSVKIAWLFGASLGFGMLTRHFFIFHLPVPTVLFGLYMMLFQTDPRHPPNLKETLSWLLVKLRDPFVLHGLLPAVLIAAGLTASWYLTEAADPLFATQQRIQAGSLTLSRGFGDVASYSFWWYALTAPGAISNVLTILFVIGLLYGIFKRHLSTSVLVVVFLAAYTALSLQKGLDWKRFPGALPVVAVLTSVWIADLRNKRLATILALCCAAVAVFNFSIVTWGAQSWRRPVALALGAPLDSHTCSARMILAFCPAPARDEDWHISDILQTVIEDPECQEHRCNLVVVQGNENFNYTIFDSYLSLDFPKSSLGVRPALLPGEGSRPINLDWLLGDYIVYIPEWSHSGYRAAVTTVLKNPPDVFFSAHQEVASFELPNELTAKLIKRIRPLTANEAEVVVEALDFFEKDTIPLQQLQLEKSEQQGDINELLQSVQELLDNGSTEEAFNLAMQALAEGVLTNKEKTTLAINVGNQLVNAGETARAIELLNQVAPNTNNVHVWVILGKAHIGEQSWGKAISDFEQALVLDPQNYWANHLLAALYAGQGKWKTVAELEQVALQSAANDGQRVESGLRLIEAYEGLEDREKACAVMQQVEQWTDKDDSRVEDLRERLVCEP